LTTWLTDADLRGEPEVSLVNRFCERAVAAGLPISRALAFNQPQMLIRPDVRFDANIRCFPEWTGTERQPY
jgi:hypothetical protein